MAGFLDFLQSLVPSAPQPGMMDRMAQGQSLANAWGGQPPAPSSTYGIQPAPAYGQDPSLIPTPQVPYVTQPPPDMSRLPQQVQPTMTDMVSPQPMAASQIQPVPEFEPFRGAYTPGNEYEGEVGQMLRSPLGNEQVEMNMLEMMNVDPLQAKYPGIGPGQGMYDTPENVYARDYDYSTDEQFKQAKKAAFRRMIGQMGSSLVGNIGDLSGAMGEFGGPISEYQSLLGSEESFREARRTGKMDEAAKMLELQAMAAGKPETMTQLEARVIGQLPPDQQLAYFNEDPASKFMKFGDLGVIDLESNVAHFESGSFQVGSPEYQQAVAEARQQKLAAQLLPQVPKKEGPSGIMAEYGDKEVPFEERLDTAQEGAKRFSAWSAGETLAPEYAASIADLEAELAQGVSPERMKEIGIEIMQRLQGAGGGTLSQ